jgi:hypothetical protein
MFDIKTMNIKSNDTIILHLNEDVDFDCACQIMEDVKNIFPSNTVFCTHPSIIESITIANTAEMTNEQPFRGLSI